MSTLVVKFCIDPSALAREQVELLDRHAGTARAVWNWGLAIKNEYFRLRTEALYELALAETGNPEIAKHLAWGTDDRVLQAQLEAGVSEEKARKVAQTAGKLWREIAELPFVETHGRSGVIGSFKLDSLFSRVAGVQRPNRSKDPQPAPQWLIDFADTLPRDWTWWGTEKHGISRYAVSKTLGNLDTALKTYFSELSKPKTPKPFTPTKPRKDGQRDGWPRFKPMAVTKPAFAIFGIKQTVETLTPRGRILVLPNIGAIRVHGDGGTRELRNLILDGGVPKSARLTKVGGRWYVSINVTMPTDRTTPTTRKQQKAGAVGVDLGVTKFATLSDGSAPINNERIGRSWTPRTLRAARALARTGKVSIIDETGTSRRVQSKGRAAARARLARINHLTALDRARRSNEVTKILATSYQTIVIEDLRVGNMTAKVAPKPDPENEGQFLPNGAAANSGRSREILDAAFYEFRRQLEYKSKWYGSEVIVVPAPYTSQTCNACGYVDAKNRDGERFYCLACGHVADADVNAAKNILAKGLATRERKLTAGSNSAA